MQWSGLSSLHGVSVLGYHILVCGIQIICPSQIRTGKLKLCTLSTILKLMLKSYANTATRYDVRKILAPDLTLDMAKYKEYSQIYLTPTFALQYGLSFASIISVISHTWLNHSKEIVSRTKAAKTQPKDIHMRMMDKYKEVPQWWFFVMLVIMMGVGLASLLPYDMQLPAWGYFLAISMSLFFLVPIGMITAMTASSPSRSSRSSTVAD